jgi:hypothetical protein
LFTAIATASTSAGVPVAKLNEWHFNPKALLLEVNLSAGTTPTYFYLAQPPRLVVDIPNTKLGYVPTQKNYSGAIQRIRVSQLKTDVTRMVLDLAPGTVLDPKQVQLQPVSKKNHTRWILRPIIAKKSTNPVKPQSSPPTSQKQPQPTYNNSQPLNNPNNQQQPLLTVPPSSNNLPPTTTNPQQQPFVTVPPLTPSQPAQQPASVLPPPTFPTQPSNSSNSNNIPPIQPQLPVPTTPDNPSNIPNPQVIEFGQPLPKNGE